MEGMIGEILTDLRLYFDALRESRIALGIALSGLAVPLLWLGTGSRISRFGPRSFLTFLVVMLIVLVIAEFSLAVALRNVAPEMFEALRPAAENGYRGGKWVAYLFAAELGIPAAFCLASLAYGLLRGIAGWLLALPGMAAAIGLVEAWLYAGPYVSCYGWNNCV